MANNVCFGCMSEKGQENVCPKCGWANNTAPESPLHLKPGTVLNGKYLIGRVLGHGGFGITYLACDLNLGSKLAIKEYFPQGMATRGIGDPTISVYSGNTKEHFEYGLEKFIDEARTLSKFDDVSEIVTIKDFFKENGTAYIVMSYIDGITLKEYVEKSGGKLPLDAALNIMLPVMKALEHVHKAGILHRDISPDNIYITKRFSVKLLDFGAARLAMGEHSKSLSVLLKPGYAPEEQYRIKGKQGPWTDVYAVGATMYRVLTGVTPPEAMERFEKDELEPISIDIVPAGIYNAIQKALALKAKDRFQSIKEFQDAILDNDNIIKSNASKGNRQAIEQGINKNGDSPREKEEVQFSSNKIIENTKVDIKENNVKEEEENNNIILPSQDVSEEGTSKEKTALRHTYKIVGLAAGLILLTFGGILLYSKTLHTDVSEPISTLVVQNTIENTSTKITMKASMSEPLKTPETSISSPSVSPNVSPNVTPGISNTPAVKSVGNSVPTAYSEPSKSSTISDPNMVKKVEEAKGYIQKGQYAKAITVLEGISGIAGNSEAYWQLGYAYFLQSVYTSDKNSSFQYSQKSIKILTEVTEHAGSADNKYLLGQAYSQASSIKTDSEQFKDAVYYQQKGVEMFMQASAGGIDAKKEISASYGRIGYLELYNKNFKSSITASLRGLEYDSNALWIRGNLATAYLLNNQYTEAEKIFIKYKDTRFKGQVTDGNKVLTNPLFADMVLETFANLRKHGINSSYMAKIENLYTGG